MTQSNPTPNNVQRKRDADAYLELSKHAVFAEKFQLSCGQWHRSAHNCKRCASCWCACASSPFAMKHMHSLNFSNQSHPCSAHTKRVTHASAHTVLGGCRPRQATAVRRSGKVAARCSYSRTLGSGRASPARKSQCTRGFDLSDRHLSKKAIVGLRSMQSTYLRASQLDQSGHSRGGDTVHRYTSLLERALLVITAFPLATARFALHLGGPTRVQHTRLSRRSQRQVILAEPLIFRPELLKLLCRLCQCHSRVATGAGIANYRVGNGRRSGCRRSRIRYDWRRHSHFGVSNSVL